MSTPRLLVLPDKFRGSISAADFCRAASEAARSRGWSCESLEMSDGGEGFSEAIAPDGDVRQATVTGPLGQPVSAKWRLARIDGAQVAVIEAAAACGLSLAGGPRHNDPMTATTHGVGELIAAALASGADQVIVGCGGSASTDGGRGALEALGAYRPGGSGGVRADVLGGIPLIVGYDVAIVFRDAAAQFAPQKGASSDQVRELTERLDVLAARYGSAGRDVSQLTGSGSAGGLAGGLAAIGGELRQGFQIVADAYGLDERIAGATAVVTGEGSLDLGSFDGKVVGGVIDACSRAGEPPSVLCVVGRASTQAAEIARSAGATLVVLSERFGTARSFGEPALLVRSVIGDWLGSLHRDDPDPERGKV